MSFSHFAFVASKVWRYPCHSPQDVCVLEARHPPEERLESWRARSPLRALSASVCHFLRQWQDCAGPFEENCIAFSPEGKVNSELAGGHLVITKTDEKRGSQCDMGM